MDKLRKLNVAHFFPKSRALGPGVRAVIWLQGCPFNCYNCISPDMISNEHRELFSADELYEKILSIDGIEGVTLSGGEPFYQSEALYEFLHKIKLSSSLSVFCFTGYLIEELKGDTGKKKILNLIDILVDGKYIDSLNTDLIWRGSSNQRLHFLTDRYKYLEYLINYKSRNYEFQFTLDNKLYFIGIPDKFILKKLSEKMDIRNIKIKF